MIDQFWWQKQILSRNWCTFILDYSYSKSTSNWSFDFEARGALLFEHPECLMVLFKITQQRSATKQGDLTDNQQSSDSRSI